MNRNGTDAYKSAYIERRNRHWLWLGVVALDQIETLSPLGSGRCWKRVRSRGPVTKYLLEAGGSRNVSVTVFFLIHVKVVKIPYLSKFFRMF